MVVEDSASFERRIAREPHGVVFVIAPWNYPYMTAINTVAPALMAGNAVVTQARQPDAPRRRADGARLREAGVPEDVFTNLFLDHATTSALIAESAFDFINFTGSVEGGRSIERAAAGTFTGLGLELGGKDPGYVMEDADLDAAVETLMDGAMYNSGQCCCGIERIYVQREPLRRLRREIGGLGRRTTSSAIRSTTKPRSGRWPTSVSPTTVRAQIAEAVASGAKALVDPSCFPQTTAAPISRRRSSSMSTIRCGS